MNRPLRLPILTIATIAAAIVITVVTSRPRVGAEAAPTNTPAPAGYKLVWSDEFDGPGIDRSKWDFDTGTGFYIAATPGHPGQWINGWGNNELESYTDRQANAFVKDGLLHIKAIKEEYHGAHYTSARLRTGGPGETPLFTQTYGRFEFRAKLPTGQGYWPALWLLPQDQAYGGWAASGEIDILENKGKSPDIVQGTIHYGASSPKNVWSGKEYRLPNNSTVADWHVYALDWEPGKISWSVDGVVYSTRDFWFSNDNAWPAPFDKPFFIIMNLAVGGQFGGDPNGDTKFPQEMLVDYVRVYQREKPVELHPQGAGSVKDHSVVETVK
jgi:beta-glucanase (GH16 family)